MEIKNVEILKMEPTDQIVQEKLQTSPMVI